MGPIRISERRSYRTPMAFQLQLVTLRRRKIASNSIVEQLVDKIIRIATQDSTPFDYADTERVEHAAAIAGRPARER